MNGAQQRRPQFHQQQQQQQQRRLSEGPLTHKGQEVYPDESDEDRMQTLLLNDDFTRGYQPSFDLSPSLGATPTPAHATVTGDRNGDGDGGGMDGTSPSLANRPFEGNTNNHNQQNHISRNNSYSHYQSTSHYRPTTSYKPSSSPSPSPSPSPSSFGGSSNLGIIDLYQANGSTPVSQNSYHNSNQYYLTSNRTYNTNINSVRVISNGVHPIQTTVSPRNSHVATPQEIPPNTPVLSTTVSWSEESEHVQEARSLVDALAQDEVNGEELLEDYGEGSEDEDASNQEHFATKMQKPAEQTQQRRPQHKQQQQQYRRPSRSPMRPASSMSAASDATSFTPRNHHRSTSGNSVYPTAPPEIPMPPLPTSQEPPGSTEMETVETLKRERTRILERRVVSGYRKISYKDISNIQPLKRGGFGEIHTAEWSRLKVVLKRGLVEHAEGVEQFEQELEILKRVHDFDFIVTFYGVTEDPRTKVKCMVMKHCTNGNLCSFLEKNHTNLTWAERYRLSIEIAKGLEFLHKSGFHHRDLHSGNILLDDKRTAMICDFGLSRSSNKSQTTDLVAAVGVASFLAPERFPIKRPVYTAACDVYSLGVVFWHISSGRIPFAKRLREPALLKELMEGHREEIASRRLKLDVVIAILQTLMAKPSEPVHQVATGFMVPSQTASAALPVPPDLGSRMAALERASNTLNKMVFNIKDSSMRETVNYIDRTRVFFRDQHMPPQPYSSNNPPQTPIYLCPLVGDLAALSYYLSRGGYDYNPINESSEQTGDTALHLACLFLESPMDTIKVLVELGADINLENLQGYTPVMILVSSNTQYCYEALKYFVMRGARIPAYIRAPITPMNSAQIYALNLVNESRVAPPMMQDSTRKIKNKGSSQNMHMLPDRLFSQGRPLIHVVAAMQDDHRILDCLGDAGLDPAVTYGGETALVAAAAHLKIKNVEWLLNHDLDLSTEAGIQRAIKVVKALYCTPAQPPSSSSSSGTANSSHSGAIYGSLGRNGKNASGGGMASSSANMLTNGYGPSGMGPLQLDRKEFPVDIRDLGRFSWAGVTFSSTDSSTMSRDMVGPVLNLLEQWTGSGRIAARKEVATKLKLMYGDELSNTDPYYNSPGAAASRLSFGSAHSGSSTGSQGSGYNPRHSAAQRSQHFQQASPGRSQRKNQKHLIDQVLNEKTTKFW
ncbi:hypothetical protein BG005_002640 [Podila minutissima]|nr:hypothetical protein BG005_002640 [Podila minutissima]